MTIPLPTRFFFTFCIAVVLALGSISTDVNAGWKDKLNELKGKVEHYKNNDNGKLSQREIAMGLKEALSVGARKSVDKLGKSNGFYRDASVKIPMPKKLDKLKKLLVRVGQRKLVDKFTLTMNRAAEQAVKSTFNVFADAIKQITIKDAVNILSGGDNAATQYFRSKKGVELHNVIIPIVRDATQKTGATANYIKIQKKSKRLNPSLARQLPNIDEYVTRKALDGLFLKIAEKEAEIRKNPRARSTALLKKVFARN